jgi:hypothetical protein
MRKILLASAAAMVMAAGAAQAQMLLYEDGGESKVAFNEWVGETFDPIAREETPPAVGQQTVQYTLAIGPAGDPHFGYPICPTPHPGVALYPDCPVLDFDSGSDADGDLGALGFN